MLNISDDQMRELNEFIDDEDFHREFDQALSDLVNEGYLKVTFRDGETFLRADDKLLEQKND